MAGDWIRMRTSLISERAVMVICDMTGLDEFAVIGRLHAAWSWAGEHTTNGTVMGVTLKTIDRVTRCENFSSAMVSVGWLEEVENGGIKFTKWTKYNSKAAKARALAAERQARKRAKSHAQKRDAQRDASVTSHAPREEESREEKKRNTKRDKSGLETPVFPDELSKNGFSDLWKRWAKHRREIKHPLTPTMVESQLKMLARLGHQRAVAMIEYTIAQGWQGLQEPRTTQPSASGSSRFADLLEGMADETK